MSFQILIQETKAHDVPFAMFLNSNNTLYLFIYLFPKSVINNNGTEINWDKRKIKLGEERQSSCN